MSEKKEKTFEESVKELENIVTELESGNLELENAIKKYTEAKKIIDLCEQKLDSATKTINKLVDENGKISDFEVPQD